MPPPTLTADALVADLAALGALAGKRDPVLTAPTRVGDEEGRTTDEVARLLSSGAAAGEKLLSASAQHTSLAEVLASTGLNADDVVAAAAHHVSVARQASAAAHALRQATSQAELPQAVEQAAQALAGSKE